MTYSESLDYIHSLLKFGINPGLERIGVLCAKLGNPQNDLKFIHVAGTNGKGSTSTLLSEILIHAGYKVGLFTSPYVIDFRERMQIDGEMISENELTEIVEIIIPIADRLMSEGMQPTEFEFITAASFYYFAKNHCDVVVLEVGLGGRFDSTNIINTPLVSVITSISYDHINILGNTLSEIAAEKCGIIKEGGITVCYPEQSDEALRVIERTARERSNRLLIPDISKITVLKDDISGTKAVINGTELKIPLMGTHMVKNCSVAVTAARALNDAGLKVSDGDIAAGVLKTRIAARMEVFDDKPLIILDGGHNEGCAKALDACIEKYLKGKRIIAVIGMMADKDCKSYLSIVVPHFSKVIASAAHNTRSLDAQTLAKAAMEYCKDCAFINEPVKAVELALSVARKDDVIIICGSFYLAAEVRNILKIPI